MNTAARLVLLAFFAFGSSGPSWAATSIFLEELTSIELRAELAAGKTTILVPIGGTEQNGPHMVLGKHNVRAKALSGKIALALGNALVAPVIAYVPEGTIDPPSQHMRFAGTITIPEDAFEKTIDSAARSFRAHGFKDVVFLGDHGGYQKNLRRVADRLNREWSRSGTRAHAAPEYYEAAEKGFSALLQRQGHSVEEIGTHAGLGDTAMALSIDPSLVRAEQLKAPPTQKDGVQGDPRKATAELGRQGVDLVVSRTVEALKKAIRR